jgi:hypothetical protein
LPQDATPQDGFLKKIKQGLKQYGVVGRIRAPDIRPDKARDLQALKVAAKGRSLTGQD